MFVEVLQVKVHILQKFIIKILYKNLSYKLTLVPFISYLCIMTFEQLKKDLEEITSRCVDNTISRQWTVYTGERGYFVFNMLMGGIDLPDNISYTYTTYKHIPKVVYLNLGNKHSLDKIKIDVRAKTYTLLKGTEIQGVFNSIKDATRGFNK